MEKGKDEQYLDAHEKKDNSYFKSARISCWSHSKHTSLVYGRLLERN